MTQDKSVRNVVHGSILTHSPRAERAMLRPGRLNIQLPTAARSAQFRVGPRSARRYLDLVMEGKIDGRNGWESSREIASLLNTHSELRDYAYGLLKAGASANAALLANAVAEGDDPDGLLLLVGLENRLQRPLISWRTIQGAVTKHVPSEQWRKPATRLLIRAAKWAGMPLLHDPPQSALPRPKKAAATHKRNGEHSAQS